MIHLKLGWAPPDTGMVVIFFVVLAVVCLSCKLSLSRELPIERHRCHFRTGMAGRVPLLLRQGGCAT